MDGLRGVAILMVIFYHAYARWPNSVPYGNQYSEIMFIKYGWLGVELFFMISGFVILMTLEKCTNLFQFIYRRWLRLFPAMFIVSMLVFSTARLLFVERPDGIPELRDLLPGLTFIDTDFFTRTFHSHWGVLEGVFWTLFIEVQFYFIFGIIYFTFGVDAAIAALIGLFSLYIINAPFVWRFAPQYMGWFASGAMYYLYFKSRKNKWLCMGLFMSLLSAAFLPKMGVDAKISASIISLIFMAVIMSERLQSVLSSKYLVFIGFISYPLYLVHENMMISLIIKLGKFIPTLPKFLLPIIPILIVVAISGLIAAYVEPSLRSILRGVFEKNTVVKRL